MTVRKFFIRLLFVLMFFLFTEELCDNLKIHGSFMIKSDVNNKILYKKKISDKKNLDIRFVHHKDKIYLSYGAPFIEVLNSSDRSIDRYIYTGAAIMYEPRVFNDYIVFIDSTATVYLFDINKQEKEVLYIDYELGDILFTYTNDSILKIDESSILINLPQGILIKYNINERKIVWKNVDFYNYFYLNLQSYNFGKNILTNMQIFQNDIVFKDNRNNLIILNIDTGQLKEKIPVFKIIKNILIHEDIYFIIHNDLNFSIYYKDLKLLSYIETISMTMSNELLGKKSQFIGNLLSSMFLSNYSLLNIPSEAQMINNSIFIKSSILKDVILKFNIKKNTFSIVKNKK